MTKYLSHNMQVSSSIYHDICGLHYIALCDITIKAEYKDLVQAEYQVQMFKLSMSMVAINYSIMYDNIHMGWCD